MEIYAVWKGAETFVVAAETPIRAIQAAMLVNGGFAYQYETAPMSMYSDKVQAKIRANARAI